MAHVSEATREVIRRLFDETVQEQVNQVLESEVGVNLPFTETWTVVQFERVRFAVLKLSGGDVGKLRDAVEVAQKDWRDVLVGSGFGHSLEAHRHWARTLQS